MSGKLSVLRALRKALGPGGRMAFYVIHTAAGLDASGKALAHRLGPRLVNSRSTYEAMLRGAGFANVRALDATPEFKRINARWLAARERHGEALRAAVGEPRLKELLADGRDTARGIKLGVLRRSLFVAW